jgi:predicted protein tyrosine phosphatase
MATYIKNKHSIIDFNLDPSLYNVLIRITNPGEEFLPLKNREIYKDIIELYFFDFTDEILGLKIFQPIHMDKIIDFFKKHRLCDNMVIHCDVGISRSAGVAIGWLIFKDDRASIYKIYHNRKHIPNRLIVERFAKRLHKSMKYIDKWEKEKFDSVKENPEDNEIEELEELEVIESNKHKNEKKKK